MKEEEIPLQPNLEKRLPLINSTSSQQSNKLPKKANKSLQRYRKKLLAQVITIFLICLVVILQRVFYQIIVQLEETTLSDFQIDTELISKDDLGNIVPQGIKNGFLKFYASLSQFPIQFLFLTHILATLYVSFDALISTKIIFISMATVYFVSVAQLFYAGGRPFWADKQILASCCLQSYNHPSLGLILMLFVPAFSYYSWRAKSKSEIGKTPLKHMFAGIVVCLLAFITQFLNYFTGTTYIINIVMSLVITTLLMLVVVAGNPMIQQAVKKTTILKTDAKKYVFYWLLGICLLGTFVMIVFSGEDLFMDIDWVDNFMKCTKYQEYPDRSYRYDEIIGPWFNFVQTATLFGWIGAIFGVSSAFRKIPNVEWAGGNLKNRLARGIVTNILIIPSWFFILLAQNQGTWIKDIGLNTFIVNSIHFFLLYLWIFGYSPILILHRILKITNMEDEQFYVIVDNTEIQGQQN